MGQPGVNGGLVMGKLGMGKLGIEDWGNNDLKLNMAENEITCIILQSLLRCVFVSEKTVAQPRVNGKSGMGKWGNEDGGNIGLRLNMAENENTFPILQSLLKCVCGCEQEDHGSAKGA